MKLTKTILEQYVREVLAENHDSEEDMAQKQLLKINEYSNMLTNLMTDEKDIPEWVQSKLAVVADDISEIYHYMHGEETLHEEVLEET
jgi:hypothetical protein